jgi:hypothetical protein
VGRHSNDPDFTDLDTTRQSWGDDGTAFDPGEHVDGNAAAGALNELLTLDITTAQSRCENCGDEGHMAEAMLYSSEMGLVGRCRRCAAVLFKLVENEQHVWLDLRGVSYLQLDREAAAG